MVISASISWTSTFHMVDLYLTKQGSLLTADYNFESFCFPYFQNTFIHEGSKLDKRRLIILGTAASAGFVLKQKKQS